MRSKNCKRASELMSIAMDRPLRFRERVALLSHLLPCVACRRFGRQLQTIRALFQTGTATTDAQAEESLTLSGAARERMQRVLISRGTS